MWREAQEIVRKKAARRFQVGVELRSDALETRRAAQHLLTQMEPLDISDRSREEIELVFCEVVNNIVEHAYPDSSDGEILVTMAYSDRGMRFEIKDHGVEMPRGEAPNGELSAPHQLPEGGFGWYLIRTLARDVKYRRRGDENHLSFRMPFEPGDQTAT